MNNFELTYIVEDDPIAATITKILLEKSLPGGRVQTYTNGQQALDHRHGECRQGDQRAKIRVAALV